MDAWVIKGGGSSEAGPLVSLASASERFRACCAAVVERFGHAGGLRGEAQARALRAACEGRDALVLLPTGGGKSLCYQAAAFQGGPGDAGVVAVVSPLVALMENQVAAARARGVGAELLASSQGKRERDRVLADLRLRQPETRLLYVTPEALAEGGGEGGGDGGGMKFAGRVLCDLARRGLLRLVAVDEAHCVSQWGTSFRPSYRRLGILTRCEGLRGVPVMALTATASGAVEEDIRTSLGLRDGLEVVRGGADRPNVRYEVRYADALNRAYAEATGRDAWDGTYVDLLELVRGALAADADAAVLVYATKKDDCGELAGRLRRDGVDARPYHAGMADRERERVARGWAKPKAPSPRCVVGTVAFGMGIDKGRVPLVAHWNLPKTLAHFYQESGRAGRDGSASRSVVYYAEGDVQSQAFIVQRQQQLDRQQQQRQRSGAGSGAGSGSGSSGQGPDAFEAFQAMVRFCTAPVCRRKQVLAHFGGGNEGGGRRPQGSRDACCDVCAEGARGVQARMDAGDASAAYGSPEVDPIAAACFGMQGRGGRGRGGAWEEDGDDRENEAPPVDEEEEEEDDAWFGAMEPPTRGDQAGGGAGGLRDDFWAQMERAEARAAAGAGPGASFRTRLGPVAARLGGAHGHPAHKPPAQVPRPVLRGASSLLGGTNRPRPVNSGFKRPRPLDPPVPTTALSRR